MAETPTPKLSGAEQAAVLMMSLGEDAAAEIMRHLGPKEVQKVGEAMAGIGNVTKDQVTNVVADFADTLGTHTALGTGNEEYLRKVLQGALGEDKAVSSSTASSSAAPPRGWRR